MKLICLTTLAFLCGAAGLSAQIIASDRVPEQAAKPVVPGELTPYFWIGGQAIAVMGKNLETDVSGISYSDNQTWLSFNVAFVDSHYDVPKKVVSQDDPAAWALSFKLSSLTGRINSYSSGPEINYPSWAVGVKGFGWKAGVLNQSNSSSGLNTGGDAGNAPVSALYGANQVLSVGELNGPLEVGLTSNYPSATDSIVTVTKSVSGSAFVGYEIPNRLDVTATVGTEKQDSSASNDRPRWAGALDFKASPLGAGSYDEPLTYTVQGNAIGSTGYSDNSFGFGLQGQVDVYLDDDFAVSPLVAFDAKVTDTWTQETEIAEGTYDFDWRTGAGVLVTLSPKQWVTDAYGELPGQSTVKNVENAKIQKFTYVQLMADFSRPELAVWNKDLNLVLKAEEPDGLLGLDDNLGAMAELRVINLLQSNPGNPVTWTAAGRVSYDLLSHTLTPYVRWAYFGPDSDGNDVKKLRLGVQWAPVKGMALEVTYMTTNLNGSPVLPQDQGRLELLWGLASDPAFRLPKNMSFNYGGTE